MKVKLTNLLKTKHADTKKRAYLTKIYKSESKYHLK